MNATPPRPGPPMMQRPLVVAATIITAALLALAARWWWPRPVATVPPPPVAAHMTEPAAAPAVAAAPSAPALPAATPEVPAPEPQASAPPLAAADLGPAFVELLGAKAARWVERDDFARRFAATVDNLGRGHAASLLWPVNPTAGKFSVITYQGRTVIAPDNAARYRPFVQFFEQVDNVRAVALYARMLPLLQRAYEELGYPRQRFHARLLAVIDHLLAAPDAPELIDVQLTEVKGPVPSLRPWVRYEFTDPALQAASAGHKLMVRVGATHQRRLKLKLQALRAELVRQAGP